MTTTEITTVRKLNVGCGPHYAKGWWNVDVGEWDEHDIHPDQIVAPTGPMPFRDVERVALGHVMEHVPWADLRDFLDDVRGIMAPGGRLCAVGPDVLRAIDRWHHGLEPFSIVEACLEHAGTLDAYEPLRHQWNCHEERAAWALREAGFVDVTPVPMASHDLDAWPVVSRAEWQFAILASVPA